MTCNRCRGLMVGEYCQDMLESGLSRIWVWRCIGCGDLMDPLILKNRRSNPLLPKVPVESSLDLGEAAA